MIEDELSCKLFSTLPKRTCSLSRYWDRHYLAVEAHEGEYHYYFFTYPHRAHEDS